jgi:hypothetical protein
MIPEIHTHQSVELLKSLHILTRDGKINQDSRRKIKQVNHLYQLIQPLMEDCFIIYNNLTLIDHGAGKSYLGFILYDLFLKQKDVGRVISIETRENLIAQSQALAQKLHFERMDFFNLTVAEATQSALLPEKVHIVTALHACDTATDDAIRFGLEKQADYLVIVPCCQAEVAATLRSGKAAALAQTPLSEIWRHKLHSREFGSHITNVLRCLLLESHGYQVTVTELVGWEHSMKNELIIAKKIGGRKASATARQTAILKELCLTELTDRFVY